MKEFKHCKGTGQARGYGCGELVPQVYHGKANRTYGLGRSCGCYQKWLLNSEAGKKKLERSTLKVRQAKEEARQGLIKARSERKLPVALDTTKKRVHEFVRERDRGKECISCGRSWHPTFEAGHYFKAELYSSLRFDIRNIHGQCFDCNNLKEGNLLEYAKRLPSRIGGDVFLSLVQDSTKYDPNFKWDIEELKQIRREIALLKKELKNPSE